MASPHSMMKDDHQDLWRRRQSFFSVMSCDYETDDSLAKSVSVLNHTLNDSVYSRDTEAEDDDDDVDSLELDSVVGVERDHFLSDQESILGGLAEGGDHAGQPWILNEKGLYHADHSHNSIVSGGGGGVFKAHGQEYGSEGGSHSGQPWTLNERGPSQLDDSRSIVSVDDSVFKAGDLTYSVKSDDLASQPWNLHQFDDSRSIISADGSAVKVCDLTYSVAGDDQPWNLNEKNVYQLDDTSSMVSADGGVASAVGGGLAYSAFKSGLNLTNTSYLPRPVLPTKDILMCRGCGCQFSFQQGLYSGRSFTSLCARCSLNQCVLVPPASEFSECTDSDHGLTPSLFSPCGDEYYLADDELDSASGCYPAYRRPSLHMGVNQDQGAVQDEPAVLYCPGNKESVLDKISRLLKGPSPQPVRKRENSIPSFHYDKWGLRFPSLVGNNSQKLHTKSNFSQTKENVANNSLTVDPSSQSGEETLGPRQLSTQGYPANTGMIAALQSLQSPSWDARNVFNNRTLVPEYDTQSSISGRSSVVTVRDVDDLLGTPSPTPRGVSGGGLEVGPPVEAKNRAEGPRSTPSPSGSMHGVEVADISVCIESVESDEDSDGMSSPNSVLRFVGKRDSHVATDNMRRERDTAGKESSNVFDGEGESSVHELCSERMRSPDSIDTESRSCVDDMDTTGYMSPDSVETEREMVVGEVDTEGERSPDSVETEREMVVGEVDTEGERSPDSVETEREMVVGEVDTEGERSPDSVETEREMVVGEVDTEGERSPDSIEMEFDFAAQRMDTVGQTHAVAKQVYNVRDQDTAGITMADLQGAAGSGVSNPADARGPDRRMDAVDTQEQDEQVRKANNVLSGVGVPKVCGLVSVVHDSGTSSLLPNIPADTNHDLEETDFHSTLNIKHNSNAGSGACSGDAVLGSRASEFHNLESKADLASGATNAYASAGKVHAMCDLRELSSDLTEKVTHEAGREASLGESDTTHREDPVDNRTGLVEGGTDGANASATDTHALNRAGKQTVNSAGVGAENDALSMGSIASGKEDTSPGALGACATVRSVAVNPTSADPQAKLKASISWILTKAYGSSIPSELKDPFYENAKGQPQVKPQLVNLMTSSEVYCQACSNMFTDTASQWQGHWSIIQVLSRKGIYVAEAGDTTVTETVLMHTAPFKVAAHLSLIDALMKAYASEIASVERIVQAVRRYSSFNASSELPGGVEEALVFWVNKTCAALVNRGDLEIIQGESNQKVRIVSKSTPPRDSKTIPKMENLMSDLGDGCSVGATIAFYQPESLPVADVCLKDCVGIADSLYNLRLIRTFCERHLVLKCFHFTYEDLLYGRENLHENVLVFMAELFYLLEACVQADSGKEGAGEGAVQASGRRIQSPGIPQVSSATKRSFQKTPDDSRHPTEKITATPSSLPSRQQPLLQRRTTPSRRSQSLSLPQERETVRRSVIAWQDDQDIRERGSNGSTLLENVSVSWDADDTDFDPVSSADLADFEFTGHNQSRNSNLDDPNHPEFLDMTSVTPGHTSARLGGRHSVSGASTDCQEPLMPAKLRPAKEKVNNHSKAEERGDRTPKKKMFSPTKPTKGKLSPPGGSVQGRVSPSGGGVVGGGGEETASQRSSGSSMDETIVTPLASVDFATPRSGDTITSSSDTPAPATQQQVQQQQPQRPGSRPAYDAFMIAPDSSTEIPLTTPRRTASRVAGQGEPPATSYTLESQVCDSQTARDLGLPVIGQSTSDFVGEGAVRQVGASREGSIGSSRSSGDFSDHESHKIHQDHKARESLKHSPRRVGEMPKYPSHAPPPALSHPLADMGGVPKPGQLITDHLPDSGDMHKKPGTTSFAQIRRMKGIGNVDNSGVVYMQQEQRDQGGHAGSGGSNLKAAFQQKADSAKRATFARLPNETTWQQSAQRNAAQGAVPSGGAGAGASASNGEHSSPPTTELSQLRLKLEEKRREIERKKHQQEVHTAKMRQRLGKAAFMRVINKQDAPAGSAGVFCAQPGLTGLRGGRDLTDSAPLVNPPSCLTQALLQERLGQVGLDEASRPTTLTTHSPISSNSTSASESPSTAAGGRSFSREGIQQTIDGVRRRWFHGSDPEGDVIRSKELEDENGVPVSELSSDMMQSCPPSMAAAAFGYSPQPSSCLGQEARASPVPVVEPERVLTERVLTERVLTRDSPPLHPQVREVSQSPRRTPERGISSGGGEQEYDQSLDNLNRSLTELQGEIKRLTLQQQEQFRTTHSPQGVPAEPGLPQHPPHQPSPPHLQPPHQQPPHHQPPSPQHQQKPAQPQHPLQPPSSRTAHGGRIAAQHPPLSNHTSHLSSPSLVPSTMDNPSPPSSIASHSHPAFAPEEEEAEAVSQEDDSSSGNGFFISMGEDTPRRPKPKPKLGKGRDGSVSRKDSSDVSDMGGAEFQRVPPLHGGGSDSSGGGALAVGGEAESSHSGSHTSLQGGSDDGSSGFTYMVGAGQEASVTDSDLEMQKKKERIIQAQIRRKEEQERKKMEKEMETQRRMQKKMLKEEEQEKKKAEEKSRREAIFQKYLQKKQDQDEEKPSAVAVTRRERSNSSQPRPKSMFVKARGGDSGEVTPRGLSAHSSQEDLSSNTSPSGSNAPLSSRPFRLNPNSRGKMRKAVSCNQLTQNGSQGASTYRRPPSPRGRPPSPGPKLFVKPNSKSNRHIIINALSYCCLAGIVNTDVKNKVLEEIARSATKHFLILFRDHGCQYRGLYNFDPESEEAYKITGIGPRNISSEMVEKFYKYNSGGKSFNEVTSTKHLSVSIDAVVLMNVYWKAKVKPASGR